MLVGTERTVAGKSAGMRTYGLVVMGSALFVIVAEVVTPTLASFGNIDQLRVMASVISGMGFLGAGLIIFREHERGLTGLTTAAGLWVAAGIGITVGYRLYEIALSATLLTITAFTAMWHLERQVLEGSVYEEHTKPQKRTSRKKKSVLKKV
jgi:putative Mg2+ transporter-C (MgtC) family protein